MRKRALTWARRSGRSAGIVGLALVCAMTLAGCAYLFVIDPQPRDTSVAVATDTQAPEVVSVVPSSRSTVDIVFDEALAPGGVVPSAFTMRDGTQVTSAAIVEGNTARLTLEPAQAKGTAYRLTIGEGAVADTAGNMNLELRVRFPGYGASGGVLTVTQGGGKSRPRDALAKRQDEVVVVDQLALEAEGGDVTVSQIRTRAVSTGRTIFADLVEAWIFEDNGDGRFQPDGRDRQLHESVPFVGMESGAPATFSDLRYTIPSGEVRTVWVVYRLGNLAVNGNYIGSRVRPGDIILSAGTLAKHGDLVSANGGRTIFIDENANEFATGRVVDPSTVVVSLAESVPPSKVKADSFTVNGAPVERAVLGSDGTTVRLTMRRPLETKTVTVDYRPGGGAPDDVGVMASFPGPTYQSPGDTLPPSVPGGISASVGTTSPVIARVSWSPSNDNNVVAGYRVWRSTAASGHYRSVGTTLSSPYTDVLGVPDQAYYYKVSAYDPTSNESTLSAATAAITATWTPQPHATYGSGNLCALCHSSHNAATTRDILRNIGGGTSGTALCYQCHDGSGATTNVKTGATDSFALASGHTLESLVDTTNVDLTNTCSDCHGPHQNRTGRPTLWRSVVNGKTVTGNNNTWCMACHDSKHSWYKPGEAAYDAKIASPSVNATYYPTLGTFPGSDVATNPAKNAHATVVEAGQTEAFACKACHDNHRGTAPQDMLLYALRPSTTASRANDRQTGAYAQMCLRCHDGSVSGATDIKQHVTADYGDPAAFGGHRVLSPGSNEPTGSPLPCYMCHNVHGSGRGNNTNFSDARGASLTTTEGASAEQVRQFCLTCHVTSEMPLASGQVWDGTLGAYRAVRTTETVVGLPRNGNSAGPDGETYNWIKLKAVDGHSNSAADKAKSCYRCHGDKYEAGKNNVHNPGPGESGGALSCGQCHEFYPSLKLNTSYHHYMVSDSAVSTNIANSGTLTTSDSRRTCLTCHVDHDIFNPTINPLNTNGRAANLRSSVASTPIAANLSTYLNTDFDPLSGAGVCTSCHMVGITKNTANRLSATDRSTAALKVTSAAYKASAHNYQSLTATFVSDAAGKAFKPNCTKCHDDRTFSEFLGTRQIASHDDTRPALITNFGIANTGANAREEFCFACHSRAIDASATTPSNPFGGAAYTTTTGMRDVYGNRSMDATSVNVKGEFTAAGIVSSHPVTATLGARVECANCHSVHSAGGPNYIVVNPDNTLNNPADGSVIPYYTRWYSESNKPLAARTNRDFCLKCHDGAAPVASANTSTTYVPYDVTVPLNQSGIANPTRRTNNKDDNQSRSHYNTTDTAAASAKAIDGTCADCHDRHGSTLPALIGVPSRASAQNILGTRYVYNLSGVAATVTANDNSVCYACHTAATSGYGGNESRTASGYPMTGRFPGSAVATVAHNTSTHLGNPHKSANVQWPGREAEYAAGDCKNCHDPHGTANAYDELRTETAAGVEGTHTYSPGSQKFCFNCHDGVPGRDIKQFYPATSGGTGAFEFAGHKIQSASPSLPVGAGLPCYECHNSHGSASPYGLQVRSLGTTAGVAFDFSSNAGVRNFCFSCHTTSDATGYGRVSAGMVTISAGTQFVVGIDRTGGALKLPVLPVPHTGHAFVDTKSCYECHGDRDYNPGGNNVHSPSIAPVTLDCYSCHGDAEFRSMDASSPARQGAYHHVLGAAGVQADRNVGTTTTGYPTSTGTLQCISCHTGHEYFDSTRGTGGTLGGSNLRVSISDANGASRTNSDYSASGSNGICISCHTTRIAKDSANQRSDGTTWSPAIANPAYSVSAHQYSVNATVTGDTSALKPNCSKCHNSQITSIYITPTAGFGVHASSERNLVSALGTALTDPTGATHCLRCHSRTTDTVGGTKKAVAGRDWYGSAGTTMSATSEKVFGAFNRAGGSRHPVAETATGSVQCESCHNPHVVSRAATATAPDNNYTPATYGTGAAKTAYCMQCHDGAPPRYVSTATTYVASTVTMTATWANKKTLEGRSHWVANGSIQGSTVAGCADCHDKHGSKFEKLVGIYDAALDTATVDGQVISGNDMSVCLGCHATVGLGYPTGVATTATVAEWDSWRLQSGVATGYVSPSPSTTRTAVMWPGQAAWSSLTNSPHFNNAYTAPGTLMGGPAKDCNTCHDVHGTSQPYDELRLAYKPGDYTLCFACHEGSFSASANIQRYYPAGGNGGDNAGHVVKTAGGTYAPDTPLPCWECHMTHGSTDGNVALLSDARWNNLSDLTINDADCRKFCLGCHTTEDRYRYSSADSTMVLVAASNTQNLIAGLPRSPVTVGSNRLLMPHLQTGSAHYKYGTEPCYECHGEDYSGASTANVHNPSSGVSSGSSACYNCHTAYLEMEDDLAAKTGTAAGNKSMYHHVLGSAGKDGDQAPGSSTYPTSTTDVYCVSCHTDHNNFNGSKNANLRSSVNSASGVATAASDFATTGNNGVCVSCHTASLAKDTTAQKNDGSTTVPKITGSTYTGSAHQYAAQSFYDSAATPFGANCSKCHDDSFDYEQDSAMPKRFGTHVSDERKGLGPLGDASSADPLVEKNCYRCHSVVADAVGGTKKSADGTDWYGGKAMTAVSQTTFGAFQLAGSTHPVDPNGNGSYVECASCHNVHVVSGTTPTVDPLNTYTPMVWNTSNKSVFCLRCHDADHGPTGSVSGVSFVPTTVAMAGADLPLMDKATLGATGHWSELAGGAIGVGEGQACGRCHDKHGSQYDKLMGVYTGGAMSINGLPVAGNDNSVCYGCHTGASTNATTTPNRSAGGYIEQGTWLGKTTWQRGYNSTEHTGSPHAQATMSWPGTGGPWAGGDCKNCHDVHGTPNSKDALRTTNAGGADTYRFSETVYTVCFACHNGSQAGVSNIATFYPAASGGTSNALRAGHKFETGARANQPLPCYDCHNPHGTGDSAYTLMVTAKTGPSTTVVLGDQPNELRLRPTMTGATYDAALREFCFACHTRGDDARGWNGSQYATMAAGTTFEGIDRTSVSNKLRLSNIGGHGSADSQSCYVCHGGTGNGDNNAHNPSTGMAEHDAVASDYVNATVSGCVGAGDGCHGGTNDLTVIHKVPGCASKTGVLNCHDIDGAGAGTTEYSSVRPGRTDGGRTSPNLDCADCHDGYYGDTYDRIGLNDIYPVGHYSEPTHTAGAGTVVAPSGGGASASCTDCHSAGTAGTGQGIHTQHQGVRMTLNNIDGNLTCKDCHSYNAAVSRVVTQSAFGAAGKVCTACHAAGVLGATDANLIKHANIAPSVIGTSTSQAGCVTSGNGCHNGGSWDLHVIHRGDGGAYDPTCGGASGCHDYTKQGAKPTSKDCDVCHVNYGTTAHYSALAHSASASMTDDADNAYENPNGEQCEDCHSAELGKSGSANTAHYNAPTVTSCSACHNDTSPNSVLVIKTNSWTPQNCDNCHTTNNNGYSAPATRHDAYGAPAHVGTPVQSNGCGTDPGCHGGTNNDLRRLHDGGASGNGSNPGCTATGGGSMGVPLGAGCHALNGARPTQKTCGGDGPGGLADGACHTTYADGNHSSANPATHIATTSTSILTSNLTSISATGNGCGRCHQDGESTYTGANIAITDLGSVSVVSSLHNTDTITGRLGCSVCHGSSRLNGGGVLGGSYTKECSSCHSTFKTNYHRSYDASHTTDTGPASGYTCTMSSCHDVNIIAEHRDYQRPTFINTTYSYPSSPSKSLDPEISTLNAVPAIVQSLEVNADTVNMLKVAVDIRSSTTKNVSAYIRVGTVQSPTWTSIIASYGASSTAILDISALSGTQNVDLYLWEAGSQSYSVYARNFRTFEGVATDNYSYAATDDCDICHNNTGRLRPDGSSDLVSDTVIPSGVGIASMNAQCETCHPYYDDYHYPHRATALSDGCLNGCHTYAPAMNTSFAFDTKTLTGKYSLWAQHADLEALGGRATTGWGDNTTGNGGSLGGGCALGQTGKTCHNNPLLPDSSECADCHGPGGMNDTEYHSAVHSLVPVNIPGKVTYTTTATVDTTLTADACVNVCHAQRLDYIHGLSTTNAYGGNTYKSTSGAQGQLACGTCHAAAPGSVIYNVNTGTSLDEGVRTLRCKDCHTGGPWPGAASAVPHFGGTGSTYTSSTALADVTNLSNEFSNTLSVGGHRVSPYTNAATQIYSWSPTAWQRGTGGGTNFTFNVNINATEGGTGSNHLLRDNVTVGTLRAGGTDLQPTTNLFCSDCHGDLNATGPQGAAVPVSMYPGFGTDWSSFRPVNWVGTDTQFTTLICYRCHSMALDNNVRNFESVHVTNGGHDVACVVCHIGVPHAWKRPKLLVRKATAGSSPADVAPYNVAPATIGGLIGFANVDGTSGSTWGDSGSCDTLAGSGGTGACTTDHSAATISP